MAFQLLLNANFSEREKIWYTFAEVYQVRKKDEKWLVVEVRKVAQITIKRREALSKLGAVKIPKKQKRCLRRTDSSNGEQPRRNGDNQKVWVGRGSIRELPSYPLIEDVLIVICRHQI